MPYTAPTTQAIVTRLAARLVARTTLTDLHPGSEDAQLIGAFAQEIRRLARGIETLKTMRVLRLMRGEDLDLFALEVLPAGIVRDPGTRSQSWVVFVRPTSTGALVIPKGHVVARADGVAYRTTAEVTILDGLTESDPVQVVALQIGSSGDCEAGAILRVVSTSPGGLTCRNTVPASGGIDRETDDDFKVRIVAHVRGLARCNRPAILARALQAQLDDGRRVRFTGGRTFPSSRPAQRILYIDDGTGTLHGEHLLTGAETLIASATGQETVSFTLRHPIVTAPTVRKDGVILEPGVDYDIDIATGEVAWIAGTTPGSAYTTDAYRHWTGLVAEAHRLIYGDPADLANVPPYVGDGVSLLVRGASSMIQAIAASGTVLDGYGVDEVLALAQSRLVTYVNTREIGGPLVSGQLVKVAMGVDGMFDFDLLDFEDVRPPENVAVRTSASIVTITEQQI